MTLRALLLDFGNVLTEPQGQAEIDAMSHLARCDVQGFTRAYWEHRPAYDDGMSPREYWARVQQSAGNPDSDTPWEALVELDLQSWTHYRDGLWDLTRRFRSEGGKTAMVTNNFPALMQRIDRDRPYSIYFDAVVASYQVGVLKPHPRIYEVCIEKLGVPWQACLFVDDRAENVEAAVRLGMQGLVFAPEDDWRLVEERVYGVRRA